MATSSNILGKLRCTYSIYGRNRSLFGLLGCDKVGKREIIGNLFSNLQNCSRNYCQNVITNKCWKCGTTNPVINIFCGNCNTIQKPNNDASYFEVFGLQEGFDIDQKDLTNKYRKMQSLIHPDKFSNKSTEEKEISEFYSSLLNKAYNTLQTPLKRALHMLNLKNEYIGESNEISDKSLLMEIMELNEEVEDAESIEDLKKLREKNRNVISELCKEISKHFKSNNIASAKEVIIKMKYYETISQRIGDTLSEKGHVE